jgi:hypothetical protein
MLILSIFLFAAAARAESVLSWAEWSPALENFGASYTSALGGSTLHRPNGNLDGRGRNLSWENSAEITYKPSKDWRIKLGGGVMRFFRPQDSKNPRPDTDLIDPFLHLSRKRLVDISGFTLAARVRYYFPVSHGTKSTVGRANDSGRGTLNFGVFPHWSVFDGDLAFAHFVEADYRLDKRAAANRENYSVKTGLNISYALSRYLSASGEYTTGNLRHSNSGRWSKLRDRQRIIAGMNIKPLIGLSVNPTLAWGANKTFRLNRAELGLGATYEFL